MEDNIQRSKWLFAGMNDIEVVSVHKETTCVHLRLELLNTHRLCVGASLHVPSSPPEVFTELTFDTARPAIDN